MKLWTSTQADIQPVSKDVFHAGRRRRFGRYNPELMEVPFWDWMVKTGSDPYWTGREFGHESKHDDVVWTFYRWGASKTVVHNRWIVTIGGVHEDSYDPEFMIYNDVIVQDLQGGVRIFGYPRETFPPTDFHTATLFEDRMGYSDFARSSFDDSILILGNIGYDEDREFWTTPMYRLDLEDLSMMRIETKGDGPGWISEHSAVRVAPHGLFVFGGRALVEDEKIPNTDTFMLDLHSLVWTRTPA